MAFAATQPAATLVVRFLERLDSAPAATLTLTPIEPPGFQRQVRMPPAGRPAVFAGLDAGRHRIRVVFDDGASAEREVALGPGEQVVLLVVPATASGAPPGAVTLTEEDRQRFWVGISLTRREWQPLPAGPVILSLLETADATAVTDRIDGGGLAPAESPRIAWRGSSWTQTRFAHGSLDLTDPAGGTPGFLPHAGLLGRVTAVTAGAPVETGGPGGSLVVEMRTPPRTWQREVAAAWTPAADRAEQDRQGSPPRIARLTAFGETSGSIGGPLGERTGLFAAAAVAEARRIERDEPFELRSRLRSALARVSATTPTGQTMELRVAVQQRLFPFSARVRFEPPRSTERAASALAQAVLHGGRGESAWALEGGYARFTARTAIPDGATGGVVDRLRDGPPAQLPLPGERRVERGEIAGRVWLGPRRLGALLHDTRAGGEARLTRLQDAWVAPAWMSERFGALAAFAWRFPDGGGTSAARIGEMAVYAADRVAIGDSLQIEAGMRVDRTSGAARGASAEVRWTTVVPRLAVRWRPPTWPRFGVTATAGRFAHRLLSLWLAWGDPAAPRAERWQWRDTNGDGRVQEDEVGPRPQLVGPGEPVGALDPGLERPVTTEVTLAAAYSARAWRLEVVGVRRTERNLLAPIDLAVSPERYRLRLLPDPGGDLLRPEDDQLLPVWERPTDLVAQDRYLLTNPPGLTSVHEGIELRVTRTGVRGALEAAATASRSIGPASHVGAGPLENDQGLAGEVAASPNASTFARGRLFFDRAYTVKVAGSVRLPREVGLGVVARYQDGQPFARLVLVPDLPQGPELVRAVPNGRHRFSYLLTVDLRVDKALRLRAGRVVVGAEIFNLLDAALGVAEDTLTGPTFRRVVAGQPPRVVRIGVRVEF